MKKRLILFFLIYFLAGQYNLFAWEAEEFNLHFHQAEHLYENGRYKEAIIEFRKALEIFPDNIIVKDYINKTEEKLRKEPVAKREAVQEERLPRPEVRQEKVRGRLERREQKLRSKEEKKQKKELAIKTKEELKAMQRLQRLAKEEERAKPLIEEVSPEQTKSQEKQKALDKIKKSIRGLLKKKQ